MVETIQIQIQMQMKIQKSEAAGGAIGGDFFSAVQRFLWTLATNTDTCMCTKRIQIQIQIQTKRIQIQIEIHTKRIQIQIQGQIQKSKSVFAIGWVFFSAVQRFLWTVTTNTDT